MGLSRSFALAAALFQVPIGLVLRFSALGSKVFLGELVAAVAFPLAVPHRRKLPREGWLAATGYALTIGLLALLHPLDERFYWLGQALHVVIYLGFFLAARSDEDFPDKVVRYWLLATIGALLAGWAMSLPMQRTMNSYSSMTPILTERFQLLVGNPNKLASYLLFIGFCLTLAMRRRARGYHWLALAVLAVLAVLTRSRDFPAVLMLPVALLYLRASRPWLRVLAATMAAGLTALILVGLLALVFAVFPLSRQFPFFEVSTPSTYQAISWGPHLRVFWAAPLAQKTFGYGYHDLRSPYFAHKRPEQVVHALKTYAATKTDEEILTKHYYQPHNTFLQVLNSGGLLWLAALAGLAGWPFLRRTRDPLVAVYFLMLLLECFQQDSVHYRWLFAGLAVAHATIVKGASREAEGEETAP